MSSLKLSLHGALTLALTVVAIALFSRDRIRLETSALGVLVVLVALFSLFPYQSGDGVFEPSTLFMGFGHEALVSICALVILGRGLERTGALQPVALAMMRLWPKYPVMALLITLVVGALLSAFANNTPIVVLLLPMLIAVCLRNDANSSGVLLPMGLATIIGGMGTTIGTSTNLLVVSIAADMGLRRFEMFDFALPVLIAGSVGILFLWLLSPRLLPVRQPPLSDTSPRIFVGSILIEEKSKVAGRTLAEALERTGGRMRVDEIQRGEHLYVMKLPTVELRPGDRLVVRDTPQNLKAFEQDLGVVLSLGPHASITDGRQQKLAEIVVTSGSALDNRTLRGVAFEMRFGLSPIALHRPGSSDQGPDLLDQRMHAGDVLLVQGDQDRIDGLKRTTELLVLHGAIDLPAHEKANIALLLMVLVVLIAALRVAPISVAAVSGVLGMLVAGCLTWRHATESLPVPVIMIIVTSLALGRALIETGGALFLADLFLAATTGLPVLATLAFIMISMAALTNVVSNNATAIIGTPVSVDIAKALDAPVEPFLLAVIFGANMSFATPIGYKTNLLVMSAGGYKFSDFMRVGIPLTILMWLVFVSLFPILYGV